jgi:dihydropteroate synthase
MEDQEKTWNNLKDQDIQDSGKEKLDSLKNSIAELKTLIDGRKELSREVLRDAEKVKMEINNFITENKQVFDKEGIREQILLKQKQVEVSETQLKEKVSCWQDIAKLKQELREQEREFTDKQSRKKMLDKILEDN